MRPSPSVAQGPLASGTECPASAAPSSFSARTQTAASVKNRTVMVARAVPTGVSISADVALGNPKLLIMPKWRAVPLQPATAAHQGHQGEKARRGRFTSLRVWQIWRWAALKGLDQCGIAGYGTSDPLTNLRTAPPRGLWSLISSHRRGRQAASSNLSCRHPDLAARLTNLRGIHEIHRAKRACRGRYCLCAKVRLINSSAFLSPNGLAGQSAVDIGFRFGAKGTHSSRTMMLEEISLLFEATGPNSTRADYAAATVDENCLAKRTFASRRLTNQRLGELYGLDPVIPLFRVFRRLWEEDRHGRAILALLTSVARDPLLACTCPTMIALPIGAHLNREPLREALRALVGARLNGDVLEKVCRNVASSWTQSGHLLGRTTKIRQAVVATPANASYALYLAYACGFRGTSLFSSSWFRVIDCDPPAGRYLSLEAKKLGFLDLRISGDVIELNLSRLDPLTAAR